MKKLLLLTICSIFLLSANSQTVNITKSGAIPDGRTLNTLAIQKAIDSLANKGGGRVYVPAGVFVTGTIELRSNINLYLESGAELKGSSNLKDYRPYKAPDFNVASNYGMIYTYNAENVSITGQGTINGNEDAFFNWEKAKKIEWGGAKNTRQKENYRAVSSGIGDGPVDPKDRPRQMVIFSQCKNVLVRDVKLTKSPFWTLHFADCDGVVVIGLKIWNSMDVPNNDGVDFTSCSNVNLSNCDIRTGDDGVVITGFSHHYELPGYHNIKHLSQNFNITNCNIQSRSSGIRIGWMDQNSVKNINISNINITNSNRGIGLFVRDEGSLENIKISQVNIETRLHTGDWWGNGEPIHISAVPGKENVKMGQIKHLMFRDIVCKGESGILLYGSEESKIEDIQFDNVQFELVKSQLNSVAGGNIDLRGSMGDKQLFAADIPAFYAQYVNKLSVNNLKITWGAIDEPYFTYGVYIKNFVSLKLNDITAGPSPSNPTLSSVLVENGTGFTSDLGIKECKKLNIK